MEQGDTFGNALKEALAIVGSDFALAVRLKIPVEKLRNWLSGKEKVTANAFLDAVDIITAAKLEAANRPKELPKIQRK